MLMSWSSPFPEENKLSVKQTNAAPQPPQQRQKISSIKQLDMVDSENTLADFVPPKPDKPAYQEKNVYDTPLYEPVQKTKEQDLMEKLNVDYSSTYFAENLDGWEVAFIDLSKQNNPKEIS